MHISSTHVIHGLKTATAAVMAYIITTALNLEFGYWAVISTVIVMQVYVADSVAMCLYRFSGTLIGALLGVLVILVVPKTPFFTGIALFLTIGICSFLTRYKNTLPDGRHHRGHRRHDRDADPGGLAFWVITGA